jgi:acyl-CoA synthetase
VLNFYGSNETGVLSGTRVGEPLERRISSGGRCIEAMQVRLYDDALQRIPGDVGVGRPACRGPANSPGYYDDEAANRELFTDDGWMLMGDYVEIDEAGWLTVIGRSADFIVRGGKNISAPAVEEEVSSHPDVAQAAAVAVPDDRLGEIVGICVQLRAGRSLDLDGLRIHLESRGVSKEWWPERLAVLAALPTSSGGKIAKGELRERLGELFPPAG